MKNRFKKLLKILGISFVLLITLILIYLFSGLFPVKKVTIIGQNDIKKDNVLKLANIDMSKNIYLLDKNLIEKNISTDKYIKSADVKRRFPSEIVISVQQYTPVASIPVTGGYVIIDEDALALNIVQKEEQIIKPLISGIKVENVKLKQLIPVKNQDELENILEIIKSTSSLNLLENISYINLAKYDDITMMTNIGIKVQFGNLNNLQYKMKLLNQILLDLSKKGKTKGTIDMRFDTDPVYFE